MDAYSRVVLKASEGHGARTCRYRRQGCPWALVRSVESTRTGRGTRVPSGPIGRPSPQLSQAQRTTQTVPRGPFATVQLPINPQCGLAILPPARVPGRCPVQASATLFPPVGGTPRRDGRPLPNLLQRVGFVFRFARVERSPNRRRHRRVPEKRREHQPQRRQAGTQRPCARRTGRSN